MKKLASSISLFALAVILFSSCSNSSKLAFTKRHYRSGYFVDRIGKTNAVPAIASAPSRIKEQMPVIIKAKSENHDIINSLAVTSQKGSKNNDNKSFTPPYKNVILTNTLASNSVNKGYVLENKQAFSEGNQGGDRAGGGSALSLLWLVIIIVLIIWLIAVVVGGFGLGGGLINLLLLIALILLILWLLRII